MQLAEAIKLAEEYGKELIFKNSNELALVDEFGEEEQLWSKQIAEMEADDFIQFYLE